MTARQQCNNHENTEKEKQIYFRFKVFRLSGLSLYNGNTHKIKHSHTSLEKEKVVENRENGSSGDDCTNAKSCTLVISLTRGYLDPFPTAKMSSD